MVIFYLIGILKSDHATKNCFHINVCPSDICDGLGCCFNINDI